jgi:hypothetical protein
MASRLVCLSKTYPPISRGKITGVRLVMFARKFQAGGQACGPGDRSVEEDPRRRARPAWESDYGADLCIWEGNSARPQQPAQPRYTTDVENVRSWGIRSRGLRRAVAPILHNLDVNDHTIEAILRHRDVTTTQLSYIKKLPKPEADSDDRPLLRGRNAHSACAAFSELGTSSKLMLRVPCTVCSLTFIYPFVPKSAPASTCCINTLRSQERIVFEQAGRPG